MSICRPNLTIILPDAEGMGDVKSLLVLKNAISTGNCDVIQEDSTIFARAMDSQRLGSLFSPVAVQYSFDLFSTERRNAMKPATISSRYQVVIPRDPGAVR